MIKFFLEGGFFMWPLLVCSVLSVAFVIERAIVHLKVRREEKLREIVQQAISMVENGSDAKEITSFLDKTGGLVGETLWAAYERYTHIAEAERSVEEKRRELQDISFNAARDYLRRNLGVLEFMTGGATLLGLLGTIQGMIMSFGAIAKAGVLGDPTIVARGISVALHTTVTGLTIALFSMVFFYIYRGNAERKTVRVEPYAFAFVDAVLKRTKSRAQ
ncbi:MAG: hypothetical protein B1H40_02465 [Candidatus Latescibacteria bacterium 4484_181]|nr:MAG: hypothetical protein B1H40_02465 [Candidatus Latescibacteria bacterium 4484_181]RKY69583.1 MAG: hypothetical protein DRQ02_00635 [Candidatus Latescibacterota bacterium]RKY69766.1 MAG: hypothetical protein DRQ24_10435 [Candidatus Latescibacterota bacterium]